jgi:hypothetical protein
MRRWIPRTLSAAALGLSLAAAAPAQQPMPPAEPVPAPVAPPVVPPPAAPETPPLPVPTAPVVVVDPYTHATPYNPTTVGRPVPNPHYNRPIYTLPCVVPNQNLDPLQPYPHRDVAGHFLRYSGSKGAGFGGGCGGGCGHGLGFLKKKGGCDDAGGSCATCQNTGDFIFGSSRTFFGESSREFFERPPSVDAIRHPHKVAKYSGYTTAP